MIVYLLEWVIGVTVVAMTGAYLLDRYKARRAAHEQSDNPRV